MQVTPLANSHPITHFAVNMTRVWALVGAAAALFRTPPSPTYYHDGTPGPEIDLSMLAIPSAHPTALVDLASGQVYTGGPANWTLTDMTPAMTASANCSLSEHAWTPPASCSPQRDFFHQADGHSHVDRRYFTGDLSPQQSQAYLHVVTRAWLDFAAWTGLCTWLAHGSLLGWYWNGMALPWDVDVDVHITMELLVELARWNNSVVVHDGGTYLVEVNPAYCNRDVGNNFIDARLIDTRLGLYIDITALTATAPPLARNAELNQLLDPEYSAKLDSSTVSPQTLEHSLNTTLAQLASSGRLVRCKNNHHYNTDELHLVKTLFEGSPAYVPKAYAAMLLREYPKSIYLREFAGYKFLPVLRLWVPKHKCKRDDIGNRCADEEVLLEAQHTEPLTSFHRYEMLSKHEVPIKQLPPIRAPAR